MQPFFLSDVIDVADDIFSDRRQEIILCAGHAIRRHKIDGIAKGPEKYFLFHGSRSKKSTHLVEINRISLVDIESKNSSGLSWNADNALPGKPVT